MLSPSLNRQVQDQITQLSDWLQDLADDAWQTLDSFVNPGTLAFRTPGAENILPPASRSKRVSLNNQELTLAVGLRPLSATQTEIQVQVYAARAYLPPQLKLSVLDADQQEVMQAEARATEAIQLKFIGSPGEQFSLRLALQNSSFAEKFII